jgi:hypothetical protein
MGPTSGLTWKWHTPNPEGLIARFWAKVEKTDGCWLWRAQIACGYGRFRSDQGNMQAHRFAWIITNGPIPDGLWVLHKCDVKICVNPEHLFLGTHEDNMADMVQKGRQKKGPGSSHGSGSFLPVNLGRYPSEEIRAKMRVSQQLRRALEKQNG